MMLRTLLIGCGAMGRTIAAGIADDPRIRITHVLEQAAFAKAVQEKLGASVKVIASLDEFDGAIDCAVECAGHEAVKAHVPAVLKRGIDVILVSMGSLAEPGLPEMLEAAAAAGGAQLMLVPGAVAGIDALAAAKPYGLDEVLYTGRKPPIGWKDTPAEKVVNLDRLEKAATIFEGTAREAARTYPKNANVAATIGIAGLGLDRTRVRLIADPGVDRNVHSLRAEGTFGLLEMTIANKPLADNPKTSALAAYSAVRALRNRAAALVI
jgi:aspartate dehydrogenase